MFFQTTLRIFVYYPEPWDAIKGPEQKNDVLRFAFFIKIILVDTKRWVEYVCVCKSGYRNITQEPFTIIQVVSNDVVLGEVDRWNKINRPQWWLRYGGKEEGKCKG